MANGKVETSDAVLQIEIDAVFPRSPVGEVMETDDLQLLDGPAPAAVVADLRARLAERAEAAEQYRIEAADLRSMFDAMQHRIDLLQQKLRAPQAGAEAAPRIAELETTVATLETRIAEWAENESELRRALAEAESTLAATRRARDQWIERLEASGREKAELERRLADTAIERADRSVEAAEIDRLRAELAQRDSELAAMRDAARAADEAPADDSVAPLAEQEERIASLLKTWTTAEEQWGSLAQSQGEIERQVAALVDDVEATRLLSDDLCAGLRDDHRRIDDLAVRLDAHPLVSGASSEDGARIEELEREVERLADVQTAVANASVVEAELRELLAELEAQRSALAEEVEAERSRRVELEAAAEEWRAAAPAVDGPDPAVLESKLAALQKTFDEAVTLHAEETRDLRAEVALQKSLAREREIEMDKLSTECAILQESVEEAISDLEGVRDERKSLSEQLRHFDAPDAETPPTNGAVAVAVADDTADFVDGEDGLEGDTAASDEIEPEVETAATLVINIDGDPVFQSAIEAAVAALPGAEFFTSLDREVAPGTSLEIAVNLASEQFHLDLLADVDRWGLDEPEVIAYCGRNGRGVFFRRVMFLPPPCDLDECSSRLLSGADAMQRLLVVGEDVDFMSGLRDSLGRVRASTAIAFDGRQAMDLIPMVKPQTVLVDLNLPRGDGLRVASQIAANKDLRHVKIAMFWSKAVDPLVFRQQAIFSMRDFHMSPEQLTHAMSQVLNDSHARPRQAGSIPSIVRRGTRQALPNPPGN